MSKMIVILLIPFLLVLNLSAQTPAIENLLKKADLETGKEKVLTLAEACRCYSSVDPPKGVEFGNQLLKLADSLKIPSAKSRIYNSISGNYWAMGDLKNARIFAGKAMGNAINFKDSVELAVSWNRMGLVFESEGKFDSCLLVFNRELELYKKIRNVERTAVSLENLGTIHMSRGEFKTAMMFLLDAKTIVEKTHDTAKLSYIYLKLGVIYSETRDYISAEQFFLKGIEMARSRNDLLRMGIGQNSLGILYKYQQKFPEALDKFNEALKIFEKIKNSYQSMSVYSNIGNVYLTQQKYSQALIFHGKALSLALKINIRMSVAAAEMGMGDDYFGEKNYVQAKIYYEKALEIYQSSRARSNLIVAYTALIKVNNSLKEYEQSVKYYDLLLAEQDSLNSKELNIALDSLKVRLHTVETEKDNALLTKEALIQSKTISLQRTIIWSSLIVLALILALVVAIVRSRSKIKHVNKLLNVSHKEISEKMEELKSMNERLIELSKLKDSMNSFLLHDLKNPLNAIINLDFRQLPETTMEAIREAGKQMLSIVNNLLDITRYENTAMKISAREISLTYILEKAFDEVKYFADRRNIHLKINYQEDVILLVDPAIIERVFMNLFSNAIKFSQEGGDIEITVIPDGQRIIKIIVKDHGSGIDPASLPFIFEKYAYGTVKNNGFHGSAGIGLTFCKMAVEAHSGKMGVNSIPGQGSSFWFTLPLADTLAGDRIDPYKMTGTEKRHAPLSLTAEEKYQLAPFLVRLRKLTVSQVSDIKDVIKDLRIYESSNILHWKIELLNALNEYNDLKYKELINISTDANV